MKQPTGTDPAIVAATVKAAQQAHQKQLQNTASLSHSGPSSMSRFLAIGIWVAFIGSMVAVFKFGS